MRHLLQPRVLTTASIAGAISALACYPRLLLWAHRPGPVWYLESTIFVCAVVLWGFVFAWHEPYMGGPVFMRKLERWPLAVVTAAGVVSALAAHAWLDPVLRAQLPEEYPADGRHWLAALLFILAFSQLFGILAPVDWLMRLTRNRWLTSALLGLLASALLLYKIQKLAVAVPSPVLTAMLVARTASGFWLVWMYGRGGAGLVSWWTLLQTSRHWLDFNPN
jgi:hypothetical protein